MPWVYENITHFDLRIKCIFCFVLFSNHNYIIYDMRYLGYPKCKIAKFQKRWQTAAKKIGGGGEGLPIYISEKFEKLRQNAWLFGTATSPIPNKTFLQMKTLVHRTESWRSLHKYDVSYTASSVWPFQWLEEWQPLTGRPGAGQKKYMSDFCRVRV